MLTVPPIIKKMLDVKKEKSVDALIYKDVRYRFRQFCEDQGDDAEPEGNDCELENLCSCLNGKE